jgi:hypothetical protein
MTFWVYGGNKQKKNRVNWPRWSRDEPIYEIFFGFFQAKRQKSWFISFSETKPPSLSCSQVEVQLGWWFISCWKKINKPEFLNAFCRCRFTRFYLGFFIVKLENGDFRSRGRKVHHFSCLILLIRAKFF